MTRINKLDQDVKEVSTLIKRVIYNRSDDNDCDVFDDEECKKQILRLLTNNSFIIEDGRILNLEGSTLYFFLSVQKQEYVEDVKEKISKYFDDYISSNAEEIKNKDKVVFITLINDLQTRVNLEKIFKTAIKTWQIKYFKGIKKANIQYVFIFNHSAKERIYEINGISRYEMMQEPPLGNSINIDCQEHQCNKQKGLVTTVNLTELIQLYNDAGDSLFDRNVRYGINEQLGVDKAIRTTLMREGDQFWYRNNGITILVNSNDFDVKYPNKIVFGKNEKFFVINGAQTITAASNFYYEKMFELEDAKKDNKKKKNDIEEIEKVIQEIKKARVLLRIICIDSKGEENDNVGNEISVSLNRQKPIKILDIAYTNEFISNMIDLIDDNKDALGMASFKLIKRGEGQSSGDVMDLVDFARARLACIDKPLEARNGSSSNFFKVGAENQFSNTDIFGDINDINDFKKKYNAIRFTHELSINYERIKNDVIEKVEGEKLKDKEQEKKISLIRNAKWFMIAQVVIALNNGNREDYSNFDYEFKDVDLQNVMSEYFDQALSAIPDDTIKLNSYKNQELYTQIKKCVDMNKVLVNVKKQ